MCSVVLTVLAVPVVFVVFAWCRFCDEFVEPQSLLPQHTYIYAYISRERERESTSDDRKTVQILAAASTASIGLANATHAAHAIKTTKFPNGKFVDSIKFICGLNWWWNFKRKKKYQNSVFGANDLTILTLIQFFLLLLFLFSAFWHKCFFLFWIGWNQIFPPHFPSPPMEIAQFVLVVVMAAICRYFSNCYFFSHW